MRSLLESSAAGRLRFTEQMIAGVAVRRPPFTL
jgi:hypothetical protein